MKKNNFMRQDIIEIRKMTDTCRQGLFQGKAMPWEDFIALLEQILSSELENKEWKEYLNCVCEDLNSETEEGERFIKLISEVGDIISNIENYIHDLWADIYMGVLRIDKDNDVCPDDLMKQGWEQKACNNIINVKNANEHYPLIDYGDEDFPMSGIPGGCKEYHQLMMQQQNIGFFDIGSSKESLKQYAFPKTHEFYQKLVDSPIENLLLLEKTQGIGYTNQLFHYLKNITQKEQLERMGKLIKLGLELPMFIRKDIVDKIWKYLLHFGYNDASVKCIDDEINGIICMITDIYEKLWGVSWQKVKTGEFPECPLEGTLKQCWKDYFSEVEVRDDFNKSKGLIGFRDVEKYQDCFTEKILWPVNKCGEELVDKLFIKIEYESECQNYKSDEKIEDKLEKIFEEAKKRELEVWDSVDPKKETKRLKSTDVYAVIHADIVKALNE